MAEHIPTETCNCDEHDMYCPHMTSREIRPALNTDLLSGLSPEELCERSDSGDCEKCGAQFDQGCQLDGPRGPSITERAQGEMWGRWAEGMAKQLGIDNE